MDEMLLPGGFRTEGSGSRERIFDNELHQWFEDAGERGLRVIFVADACHYGTLTRRFDPRAPDARFGTSKYTIADDMLELDISKASTGSDDSPAEHVMFLAAGQAEFADLIDRFGVEVQAKWNEADLTRRIIASQRQRRVVLEARRSGAPVRWNHGERPGEDVI